jgi:hypothetical protein
MKWKGRKILVSSHLRSDQIRSDVLATQCLALPCLILHRDPEVHATVSGPGSARQDDDVSM